MTTDDSKAALAAALIPVSHALLFPGDKGYAKWRLQTAAAILAALDGWELVPTGSADYDVGYDEGRRTAMAERERLRRLVPADAAPVDAERLALAMTAAGLGPTQRFNDIFAVQIAREYTALAPAASEP
jgi:hypothetical protein